MRLGTDTNMNMNTTQEQLHHEMEQFLSQKFDRFIYSISIEYKVDLDQKNHLSGLKRGYLKLTFMNSFDMNQVKRQIREVVKRNKANQEASEAYGDMFSNTRSANDNNNTMASSTAMALRVRHVRHVLFLFSLCLCSVFVPSSCFGCGIS